MDPPPMVAEAVPHKDGQERIDANEEHARHRNRPHTHLCFAVLNIDRLRLVRLTGRLCEAAPVLGGEFEVGALMGVGFAVAKLVVRTSPAIGLARARVARVKRNLLARTTLVETGHSVVSSKKESYIYHEATGAKTMLKQISGQYEVVYTLERFGRAPAPVPRG